MNESERERKREIDEMKMTGRREIREQENMKKSFFILVGMEET